MIIANLKDWRRYAALHPKMSDLFEFVEKTDLSTLLPGTIKLSGDELFINVNDSELVARQAQKLEVHRRYIDVHIPLTEAEDFGWRHLSTLSQSDEPFDQERDFALYSAQPHKWFTLCPGEFCIVYPEDAHAPIVGQGRTKKLVAKILL